MSIGDASIRRALTNARVWSWVISRVKTYTPRTASTVPITIAITGEPKRTSATSITPGHPRVYWEKNCPSLSPVSHGWKKCGMSPAVVSSWPCFRPWICQRYVTSSRFHDRPG